MTIHAQNVSIVGTLSVQDASLDFPALGDIQNLSINAGFIWTDNLSTHGATFFGGCLNVWGDYFAYSSLFVAGTDLNISGGLYLQGAIDWQLGNSTTTVDHVGIYGAHLSLTLADDAPEVGSALTLIHANAVDGIFDDLAEGTFITIGSYLYQISYVGGDSGHDVTLTRL